MILKLEKLPSSIEGFFLYFSLFSNGDDVCRVMWCEVHYLKIVSFLKIRHVSPVRSRDLPSKNLGPLFGITSIQNCKMDK